MQDVYRASWNAVTRTLTVSFAAPPEVTPFHAEEKVYVLFPRAYPPPRYATHGVCDTHLTTVCLGNVTAGAQAPPFCFCDAESPLVRTAVRALQCAWYPGLTACDARLQAMTEGVQAVMESLSP